MSNSTPLRQLVALLDELQADKQQIHDQAIELWGQSFAEIDKQLMLQIDRCNSEGENKAEHPLTSNTSQLHAQFDNACRSAVGRKVNSILEANIDRYQNRVNEIGRLFPIAERTAQQTRLIHPPERIPNALNLLSQAVTALHVWRPAYSPDDLFRQRLGSNPNSDGQGEFRDIISEQSEDKWADALERYAVARIEVLKIAAICEPSESELRAVNPFQQLIQFVDDVIQKETVRLSSLRNRRESVTDIAPRNLALENELNRMVESAIAAGWNTGFPMEIVERRVRAIEQVCREALCWQRDAPEPDPDADHPDDEHPASGFLIPIYQRFVELSTEVQTLGAAFQTSISHPIPPRNEPDRFATTPPHESVIVPGTTPPPHWETQLHESVDDLDGAIRWLDLQIEIAQRVTRIGSELKSEWKEPTVRDSWRLLGHHHIAEVIERPSAPVTDQAVTAYLERVRRMLQQRKISPPTTIVSQPLKDQPPFAAHSEDFATVRIGETEYTFTPIQRPILAALWQAWEKKTKWLSHAHLQEAADTSSRIVDLFKGHQAWGKLIVKSDRIKDLYSLEIPGS